MASDQAKPYTDEEVLQKIQEHGLAGWTLEDGWLRRKFSTDGWPTTLMLVNTIGYLCEAAWHHADLSVTWGKVWCKLKTHSAGGITDKDFALAHKIEEVVLWRPESGGPLEGHPTSSCTANPKSIESCKIDESEACGWLEPHSRHGRFRRFLKPSAAGRWLRPVRGSEPSSVQSTACAWDYCGVASRWPQRRYQDHGTSAVRSTRPVGSHGSHAARTDTSPRRAISASRQVRYEERALGRVAYRTVLGDMFGLCLFQLFKSLWIAIDHFQAMAHLVHPEIQVRNLTGQLMSVQRDEPGQLGGQELRNL